MKNACSQVPFHFFPQQSFCLSKQQALPFFKVHFLAVECQVSRNHTGMLNDGCQHEMQGLYQPLPHLCSGVVRIRNRSPHSQTDTYSFKIFTFTASYIPIWQAHVYSFTLLSHLLATEREGERGWNRLRTTSYTGKFPLLQSKLCVSVHVHLSVQGTRTDIPLTLSIKHTEICISMSLHVVAKNKLSELLLIQQFIYVSW